jgi:serine/threonine protein kinase
VYSAWDPQWDRVVELQILPSKISRDKDLRDEIRRQLEIVRGFSHPHICALYELGLQDSATFLVLEHLEGELLSHRLKDGPLPLQEALRYATQIAFALSDIHARGLVHGDLQTSAVMITEHAGAKLLELGLAPLSPRRAGEGQTQNESTICFDSLDATERGEAEDVLALGSILYEMVTGRKPFDASETDGNTSLDPPLLAPAQCFIPTALKELIRNCFGKNPDCTLTTAETVRARLEAISRSDEIKARTAPTMWSKASKPLTAILLTALVLVLASGRPWLASDVESVTSVILPPENAAFASAGREGGGPAISPDGQHVVFPAFSSGQRSLWMREVASLEARLIPSTEGASSPFWSPDSRTVGFFSDGKLKKVDAGGGPVIVISDADTPPAGGAFNQEGTALFGSIAGPIFAVHRPGEIPKPVTKLSRDEGSHRWPFFLPDGDHFLFFAAEAGSGRESQTGRVYVGSVAKNESRLLPIDPDSNVVYASGYLLYLQDGSLMAQAFDHARFALNGAPIKVTDQVFYETRIWRGNFSASDNGRLVYQPGREDSGAQLLWFNRSGVRIKTLGDEKLNISGISISKSGRKIVSDIFEPQSRLRDLWVHDSRTGIRSRLTFDPVRHEFPVWSPDESKVVFSRVSKDGRRDIYMKSLDGNGEETPLLQTEEQETPTDWSPDGRFIAYHSWIRGTRKLQIHVLPLEGVRKPFGFLVSEDSNGFATFSPDGHWLAFTSTKGNREEVYVASFPSGSGLTQISLEGGQSPRWNANGREIFYATPDSRLISARVRRSGTQLEVTSRKPLFTMATRKFVYDVAPTGNEFLVNTIQPSVSTPFILVTNWSRKVKDQP